MHIKKTTEKPQVSIAAFLAPMPNPQAQNALLLMLLAAAAGEHDEENGGESSDGEFGPTRMEYESGEGTGGEYGGGEGTGGEYGGGEGPTFDEMELEESGLPRGTKLAIGAISALGVLMVVVVAMLYLHGRHEREARAHEQAVIARVHRMQRERREKAHQLKKQARHAIAAHHAEAGSGRANNPPSIAVNAGVQSKTAPAQTLSTQPKNAKPVSDAQGAKATHGKGPAATSMNSTRHTSPHVAALDHPGHPAKAPETAQGASKSGAAMVSAQLHQIQRSIHSLQAQMGSLRKAMTSAQEAVAKAKAKGHTQANEVQLAALKSKEIKLVAENKHLRGAVHWLNEVRARLKKKLEAKSVYPGWCVIGTGPSSAVLSGPDHATKLVHLGTPIFGAKVTQIDPRKNIVVTTHGVFNCAA